MAFTAKKYWDQKKRTAFSKNEMKCLLTSSLVNNEIMPFDIRQSLKNKFVKNFKKKSSMCRVKNRCLISNRSYSVIRHFRVSRLVFRELARNGSLLGVRRASW